MFDVNTMLQSVDFNAEQLDAWTNYGKSLSTNSFFGGNGSPSSSMGGMFGTGGDLNEDAIRDIIIKFLDLPRPIMQESLAQCLLMEGNNRIMEGWKPQSKKKEDAHVIIFIIIFAKEWLSCLSGL